MESRAGRTTPGSEKTSSLNVEGTRNLRGSDPRRWPCAPRASSSVGRAAGFYPAGPEFEPQGAHVAASGVHPVH